MAELGGIPPGGPVDALTALREMVDFNGGVPLTCLA
jgi:cyclase